METEVVKRLINVDEYYKMAEVGILKPDDHVELIHGEIFQMSPIGSRHAAIVDRLARTLNQLLPDQINIRVQNPIRFDMNNEPEPDISLLKYKADDYASAHPGPADVLALFEVAGSSIRFDREVKAALYATHGIRECWIIDLDNNQIEFFSEPQGDAYTETRVFRPGDEVSIMGRKISVKELLILN
ncbi:Endonuclease, Uma2 family (restriction endonuclease fold) [Cyclobacterium lianum]|uniref:Endonuclease, Uma2 family (Restriction endonuclease fold) n=1 Tax=Cyclobacterium lianum TaxID=388280 RepID=A0A1M7P0Q3_9BACT|nr:Uma2 family endonuclease [Cyclobacterium lianum]SHN10021.1 Endonuclease, Uma2 family (restriction endonuclease fold) [Cyclobacterium lianum]